MELFLMRAHPQHCIDPAPAWNWWLARDACRLQDSPHRPWWGIEVHCTDSVVRYNQNTFFLIAFYFFSTSLHINPVVCIGGLSMFKSDFWSLAAFGELKSTPANNP